MNADVLNAELLFKIIFSTNQLSICGAVSNWCYQFGLQEGEEHEIATAQETLCTEILKSVNAEEVNSLVPSPRTTLASGNRLSEHLKTFKLSTKRKSILNALRFGIILEKGRGRRLLHNKTKYRTRMEWPHSSMPRIHTHFLEDILTPECFSQFQEGQQLDQSLKFKSYGCWDLMDSKSQFHQNVTI